MQRDPREKAFSTIVNQPNTSNEWNILWKWLTSFRTFFFILGSLLWMLGYRIKKREQDPGNMIFKKNHLSYTDILAVIVIQNVM